MRHSIKRIFSLITITAIAVSSTALLSTDAATTSRTYIKYTYATNQTSNYVLSLDEASATATRSSDLGVIGEDDRYRDGHDGIVYLSTGGTGFIVDDHVIATAAHCIANFTNENLASTHYFLPNVEIYMYNNDGTFSGTKLTPIEAHVPYNRQSTTSSIKQKNDYALLTVEEDLSNYTHFDLGHAYDTSNTNSTDIPVFVTGFPQDVVGTDNSYSETAPPLMYTGAGHIYAPTAYIEDLLYFDADTTGGNSGGPVYTITNFTVGDTNYTQYTAISLSGIASVSKNWGPRFTAPIIQFYKNNANISY